MLLRPRAVARRSHHRSFSLFTDLDGSEVQLDTTLVEDKDSGEDENDGNDESDTEENEPVGGAPTIELKVALGSLDENPGIALLADASDNEKETEKNSKDCNAADGKPAARLKLALDALKPQETNQSTTTKKRKQAPIEELS